MSPLALPLIRIPSRRSEVWEPIRLRVPACRRIFQFPPKTQTLPLISARLLQLFECHVGLAFSQLVPVHRCRELTSPLPPSWLRPLTECRRVNRSPDSGFFKVRASGQRLHFLGRLSTMAALQNTSGLMNLSRGQQCLLKIRMDWSVWTFTGEWWGLEVVWARYCTNAAGLSSALWAIGSMPLSVVFTFLILFPVTHLG